MNCREALQHLYDYLDKELTEDMVRKIENHLSTCDHCLDKFEFEKLLHQMLAKKGQVSVDAEPLKMKVMERIKQIESEGDSAGFFNRYRPYLSTAAAIILIFIGLYSYLSKSSSRLYESFAKCHLDTSRTCNKADFSPMLRPAIDSCVASILPSPELFLTSADDRDAAVAAVADYEGEHALHLMYRYQGDNVSVFVIPNSGFAPRENLEVRNHGNHRYLCTSIDGMSVVIWKCKSVWCVAVSALERDRLITFASAY